MQHSLYDLTGRVAVVTGGSGALGSACCRGLAEAGASVVILARNKKRVEDAARTLEEAGATAAAGIPADVLKKDQLTAARDLIVERFGRVDILVNAAGGNIKSATLKPGDSIFDMPETAFRQVFDLNLIGTVLPTQVFGEVMGVAENKNDATEEGTKIPGAGSIVNVSSMAAARALTGCGLFRSQGFRREFHPVDGRGTRPDVRRWTPRECYRAGVLHRRTEPEPAPE